MQPYVTEANNQLAPAYDQQRSAVQSQIPAIQQLYDVINRGLDIQGKAQKQDIYEQASGRGVLRSTIPVNRQTALAGSILQQKGELGARQAQEVSKVNSELGSLGVNQVSAVSQLAQALANRALQDRQLQVQQEQANRSYDLQRQLADRDYQLQLAQYRRGY